MPIKETNNNLVRYSFALHAEKDSHLIEMLSQGKNSEIIKESLQLRYEREVSHSQTNMLRRMDSKIDELLEKIESGIIMSPEKNEVVEKQKEQINEDRKKLLAGKLGL